LDLLFIMHCIRYKWLHRELNLGIGKQLVERLKIAGKHTKKSALEERFFNNYILGRKDLSSDKKIDISAIVYIPLSKEFQENVIKSAEKIRLDLPRHFRELGSLFPKLSSKIPSFKKDDKLLTRPEGSTFFARVPRIENNQKAITGNFIRSKL
jgi:hypothetical protein